MYETIPVRYDTNHFILNSQILHAHITYIMAWLNTQFLLDGTFFAFKKKKIIIIFLNKYMPGYDVAPTKVQSPF